MAKIVVSSVTLDVIGDGWEVMAINKKKQKIKNKMTDFLDRYVAAQEKTKNLAGCLAIMHSMRSMILKNNPKETDRPLEESLVEFDLLGNLSRASSDILGALVWLARDRNTGRLVVVKQYAHAADAWNIPSSALRQLYCSCRFLRAQLEHHNLQHAIRTNVQTLLDVQISETMTVMVFAYYPLMFEQVFPVHMQHDASFKLGVINELMLAVQAMHDAGVAHRDIKIQNIAFDETTHVVLIDFDSGAQTTPHETNTVLQRRTRPVCSLFTRPPEHFDDAKCDVYDAFAGDWWSTGCVIAQLFLFGQHLFDVKTNDNAIFKDIQDFCSEFDICFASNATTSRNTRVKSLMRAPMTLELRTLLHGLLHLNPDVRKAAASTYIARLRA